jgi:S1-C subfamily serine protease
MDNEGFEQDEQPNPPEPEGSSWLPASEPPTVPGLDPTDNLPPVTSQGPGENPPPPGSEGQPKWQPLPGGNWPPPPQAGQPAQPGYGYGQQGSYGPPPAGYGYGAPYGQGPGGPGWYSYETSPQPAGPPSGWSTGKKIFLAVIVAVLVAAAGSVGAIVGTASSGTHSSAGTQPIPSPASPSDTGNAHLNVDKIASKVDPATVDITSVLASQNAEAEGTGMILTSNGEVLTNNHVIEGASRITAQVDGTGRRYTVKVLGTDVTADVALVQLEGASRLPTVKIGNSSSTTVGDPVVAIGNALGLGGTPTVTSGIISALNRSINASDAGSSVTEHLTGLLQTDAPINPGNSGGPLVDSSGQVIGMDTAALTGNGTQSASNVGFAIPIDRAIAIAQAIQEGRSSSTILIGPKGILGVDVLSVQQAEQQSAGFFGQSGISSPVSHGAYVQQVVNGSPAQAAGITSGDVITGLNGKKILGPSALSTALSGDKPGTSVSVTWVTSSGKTHTARLTLEADPQAA